MSTLPTISPELIKKYQEEISKNSSSATAKRKAASLNKFFGWAEDKGHIDVNPMPPTLQAVENNYVVTSVKPSRNIGLKTWAILGTTFGIIILIFLLTWKLGSPIQFIKNFAAGTDNNPTAQIIVDNQSILPDATPSGAISAVPAANGPWNLYANLKLTDEDGSPRVGSETITFKIYNTETEGTALYTSDPQTVTTDGSGSVLISLDGVPSELFFQNNKLFLDPNISSVSGSVRIPVSTANTAANLGGYFAANPAIGADVLTVPVIDSNGSLNLASESPAINAKAGNLLVQGQAVILKTIDGTNGNIEINPDGKGIAHFLFEGSKGNFLNAQAPNLNSGSLYYGIVANNSTGYDLLKLQNGSNPITRFSVDSLGNTTATGNINAGGDLQTSGVSRVTSGGALKNITGYSQNSGNFTINQNVGDFGSIVKTGTALNNVLNLTLDERNTANTSYSTLVLNRYNAFGTGMALLVANGNAQFDGIVKLGNYTSNPGNIGTGSLVYNTTDNKVYYWDGTTWQSFATGSNSFSGAFTDLTSGTNTQAAMIVGTGASLTYSGGGTINASSLNGIGSSSFLRSDTSTNYTSGTFTTDAGTTFNIAGGFQAGGAAGTTGQLLTSAGAGNTPTWSNIASLLTAGTDISITGTTNATINDTSTLATVTGRGATTNTQVSLNGGITSTGDLTLSPTGNVVITKPTTLNTVTYTWPGADGTGGQVLSTNGTGGLSWTSALTASSVFWTQDSLTGVLYPKNNTVDLLVGSDSTTSAKFAFTGVTGGLPTASIAGNITNVATYLTGNGNLATTNMNHITLGGTSTGGIDFASPITSGVWNGTAIGATYGGTGQSSYTVGDLLYADTTTTLAKLNDVAVGNALISGGIGVAPSWGKIVLGTHTTGNYVSSLAGTPNQITASASTGDITLSIPSEFIAPGSINAVTGIKTGAASGTQRIDASGNLTSIGTTQINGVTYTWPGTATANYVLQSTGTGASSTLAWVDPAAAVASNIYWAQDSLNGVLYPKNNTVDVLIGSNATTSAKFAFTGVTGGLPTASIAGNVANVATYLTGNGNLATTNMNHITLGGTSTGGIDFASPITSGTWNGSTIAADYGGTGQSSYTVGDLLYADTTSTLAKLNDVATGNVLISGGIGVAPSYGKVTLGTHTTGNYVSSLAGTANQITASSSTGDVTLTIPSDFRAPGTVNAVNGLYTGATAGTQRIDASGNLTNIGTTQLNGVTYTWPASAIANYVLQSTGTGATSTLAWVDPAAAAASSIYWTSAGGALFPKNNSLDVLIGSTATTSAKFAFTGVAAGVPTASISGATDVATFIDGNGNISTTNRKDLTLGNSATYDSTGNVLINPNGTGNVGIGDASPLATLTVGSGDLFQVAGATGNITTAGTLAVNGDIITADGATLTVNAAGNVDVQDALNADSITSDAGVSIASGNSYTGAGAVTLSSAATTALTVDSGTTGAIDIGTSANAKNITIGNTTGATTLNLTKGATGNIVLTGFDCSTYVNSGKLTTDASGNVVCANDEGGGVASVYWSDLLDAQADTTIGMSDFATDMGWASLTKGFDGLTLDITDTGDANYTQNLLVLRNMEDSNVGVVDFNVESLLLIDNADTNTEGSTLVDNGILFTNSGGLSGGIVDAIDASATEIVNALNIGANNIIGTTGDINLTNFDVTGSSGNIVTAGTASISGSLTFSAGAGSIQTTAGNPLTIGGDTTGNITLNPSNGIAGGFVAPNTTNVTDLGTASLLFRNIYGTAIYQGVNQVCDTGGNCSGIGNFWTESLGALYPVNNSRDLLIGGSATSSAKFAFTGVTGGLPTASISGTTANVSAYLTGNGNLAVTNMADLTLGGGTTGNVIANSPFTAASITDTGLTASKGVFTDANKQLTSTGTLGTDQGGTGFSSYTVGDLLYADTTSTLAKLSDIATGNVLISGGVGVAPSYGKVTLGSHTTGNYVSTIAGTTNQITSSGSTGDVTLSIPSDFRAPGTVNAVNGLYTGATAGTQRIDASGNLTNIGTTQLNGVTYTWPASAIANYVLQSTGTGATSTLTWVDPAAAAASSIYWTSAGGALFPKNNSLDVLIGSTATTSAKFAFTGVTNGLPTASIAGTTANVSAYLTGNGNLAVTNNANLTLGGATTGNVISSSPFSAGSITDTGLTASKGVFTDANKQLTSTGTLGIDQGGTGLTSYTTGDLIYASNTNVLSQLADVATGNVLLSGGVGTAPSWGKVVLGTHTTGNYVSSLAGTANQITASAATGDITLSIPSDFRAPGTVNAVNGIYTGATAGTQRIDASGNLTSIGTTQLNGVTYTWPGTATANYVLQSTGTGATSTLAWVDPATVAASSIYWTSSGGALYPKNNSLDLLIGSTATTSAKFAFTGVTGGLPTASISGTTANVSAYLTGNGNLAVTNNANLTLGGATTGNVIASSPFTAASITDTGLTASKGVFTDANKQLTSTGTLGTDQGGTGLTSYTTGDLIYASNTNVLSQLADVAVGNALISGGIGVAPSWGKIVLGTHTTGNYVSTITGTANQITASAATGDITLSIPSDFRAPGTVNAVNGLYTGATAGTQRIDASGNLVNIGTTQLNGTTYTWPGLGTQSPNFVLQTNGSGTLSWAAQTGGTNYWGIDAGALYPLNNSVDLLLGATATTSAKFAFKNVLTGVPTASVSGLVANVATFIDGNGNISTTNRNNLTLGNSATYNTTGNILLNPNGVGNVAIGTTIPTAMLDVAGAASISGSLSFRAGAGSIQTTAGNPLTIGGATTGNITLNPSNSIAGGFVAPNTTNVTDLGTASLLFRNIYGTTLYQGVNQVCDAGGAVAGCGGINYWQLNNKILSPANSTYDLAIGGTATGSAFQVFGAPTVAGDITKLTSSVITTGNLFEATASAITSGNIIKLGESGTQNFTGNGIYMGFDNTGGGSFTGNFLSFDNAGSSKFTLNSAGNITAGTYNTNTFTASALTFAGTNPAISASTTNTGLTIDANGTGTVSIGGTSTGDILLGGGSASTGCTITNSSGNLTCAGLGTFGGALQAGTITTPTAYSRFVTSAATTTGHGFTSAQDVLMGGNLEVNGVIYLDGGIIANPSGVSTIILATDPAAVNDRNILDNGVWWINNAANDGMAALMVNQQKGGDIFSASSSGNAKFTIHNDGSITLAGMTSTTNTAEGTVYYDTDVDHLYLRTGDSAFHRVALDMTKYASTAANIVNQGYVEIAHNQNTNDLSVTGWFYNTLTSTWQNISDFTHNLTQNLQNQFDDSTSKIRTQTRLTDIELSPGIDTGTGADDALDLSATVGNYNLNTANRVGRSCGDGGDAVNYTVTALTSTSATLDQSPATGCLVAGDEVLLINLRGANAAFGNVGNYETLRVSSVSTNTVTFTTAKTKYYGDGLGDDTNLGYGTGNQAVMLQRVPNYTTVTVGASAVLISADWISPTGSSATEAGEGGVLFFRATGAVSVSGSISAASKGYVAPAGAAAGLGGNGGESICGIGGTGGNGANGGNGATGGGSDSNFTGGNGSCGGGGGTNGTGSASSGGGGGGGGSGAGGGGGGYGTFGYAGKISTTAGSNGGTDSSGNGGAQYNASLSGGGGGGGTYGTTGLDKLFFGTSGGAGGSYATTTGGAGGDGGGIVMVSANSVTISGSISGNGGAGTNAPAGAYYLGGGGGGAGGSIKLIGNSISLGTNITSSAGTGGNGNWNGTLGTDSGGGAGGAGRIAVYSTSASTGSTTPSYNFTSVGYYPYGLYHSAVISTPNAVTLESLRWEYPTIANTKISFQTRSGNSTDPTDGTWEAWKPAIASINYLSLQSANTHTDWTGTGATVADGTVTRNVDQFEDEDEATAGNTTKFVNTAQGAGYAEATITSTDISAYDYLTAWVYATASGNTVKLGFGESAATEQEESVTIDATNTWQKVYWDLSDIAAASRDGVTKLRVTNLNNPWNTIHFDNIEVEKAMTVSSGTPIASTPNNYLQYRVIFTTTNTSYQPQLENISITYNDGYKVVQTDANTVRLYNFSGQTQNIRLDAIVFGADLAEYYAVNDQNIGAGDVVAVTGELDDYMVPILRRSSEVNDSGLIGVISTKAGQTLGIEADDRRLLALAGRVPVKMASSSAAIKYGESVTSSDQPGRAKKASFGEKSIGTALESWSPDSGKDTVMIFVGNSNFTTSTLADLNAYSLNAIVNAEKIGYDITDAVGQTIDSVGVFSQLLVANITAGAIITRDLAADTFTSFQGTIDNLLVKSGLVAGNIQTKLISPLADDTDITVQIGSIATPSGKFAIQNATGTEVASIDEAGNATFSGIVRSQNIDEIQALLTQVTTDQSLLLSATASANLNASGSANISELITDDMYVTNQATMNSVSIANSLTLGSDLVIGLGGNTINSLSAPLEIQSLAMAPVEIMGGLVSIDTQGNMHIAGNLNVGGDLAVAGKITTPELDTGTINATGSATLNSVTTPQFIVAAADATVAGTIVNGVITTNSTIGQATIPAGTSEIIIQNPKVTDYTLVYVTPTSPTDNNVLYVKSKTAGQFIVGFTNPIDTDTNFNWWIVQVTQ